MSHFILVGGGGRLVLAHRIDKTVNAFTDFIFVFDTVTVYDKKYVQLFIDIARKYGILKIFIVMLHSRR